MRAILRPNGIKLHVVISASVFGRGKLVPCCLTSLQSAITMCSLGDKGVQVSE